MIGPGATDKAFIPVKRHRAKHKAAYPWKPPTRLIARPPSMNW